MRVSSAVISAVISSARSQARIPYPCQIGSHSGQHLLGKEVSKIFGSFPHGKKMSSGSQVNEAPLRYTSHAGSSLPLRLEKSTSRCAIRCEGHPLCPMLHPLFHAYFKCIRPIMLTLNSRSKIMTQIDRKGTPGLIPSHRLDSAVNS